MENPEEGIMLEATAFSQPISELSLPEVVFGTLFLLLLIALVVTAFFLFSIAIGTLVEKAFHGVCAVSRWIKPRLGFGKVV